MVAVFLHGGAGAGELEEQREGLAVIRRLRALAEPGEHVAQLGRAAGPIALAGEEPRPARRQPQLPRLAGERAGDLGAAREAALGLGLVAPCLQCELALDAQ